MIYREENGNYQIDCRKAIWSTDQMHDDYHVSGVSLSDADFIVEAQDFIYLIEYKNGVIEAAIVHGADFDPSKHEHVNRVAKKFFDSVHYLTVKDKHKPIKYIYIVEYSRADTTTRKMLRNEIAKKLPFKLQLDQPGKAIHHFDVLSINEWNAHDEYSNFPLIPVDSE